MRHDQIAFQQGARVLPEPLRGEALSIPEEVQSRVEEIRLRVGQPIAAVFPEGEKWIGQCVVRSTHLEQLVEIASCASVHSVLSQLREGFLTIQGGHRIGLCGTAVMEGGELQILREFSSASIRIARQFPGIALPLLGELWEGGRLQSTLIVAPPGGGKTSLLRDLVRIVSNGEGRQPLRVGVVDQRGELGAAYRGVPQLELGVHTDLLTGSPKAHGLMLLLRAMNPQVLAVDEVSAPEDVQALVSAAGCGVVLLATAHGDGIEDLERRPVYRQLLEEGIFRRAVTIHGCGGERHYQVEVLG